MTKQRRDPHVYLEDIRSAIDKIAAYTAGGNEAFIGDEMMQDAVIRQVSIIGEAASKLPKSVRQQHPEIAWKDAIGMRNILIHDYSDTSIQRVWETVQEDLPPLRRAVDSLLERKAA